MSESSKFIPKQAQYLYDLPNFNSKCDIWHDNKRFLGCHGQSRPPYSIINYGIKERSAAQGSLCDDLNIKDIAKAMDETVYVFNDDNYWIINGFPNDIHILAVEKADQKWPGFRDNPNAVMIVQEGPLRGQTFEFNRLTYNQWSVEGMPKIEDQKFVKLTAILQNSDALEPIVIGFGAKQVCFIHFRNILSMLIFI